MNTKDLQIDTLKSVGVTQIIPDNWKNFIWTGLSDDAPFSWGDNNHSLVDAPSFKEHLENVLNFYEEDYEEIKENRIPIMDTIKYLHENNIFIDLEQ